MLTDTTCWVRVAVCSLKFSKHSEKEFHNFFIEFKKIGHNVFYHRVVIEKSSQKEKELLFLQCVIPGDFNMEFVRLDWLRESIPYNFSQPTTPPLSVAPDIVPYVNMAIREKGLQIDTSAIVHPGTMLDLLIYLDKESSGQSMQQV
ncbi:hypothetical protein AVEN_62124-1 [Araneus ventricosus]|uniref:Uncharacterized protein n=1 Tax=Araneus ventricosus TaxID=182803 RepID=A0A4Y2SHA5_ARAVE|nr:hypothetical protein AVEN_62124-1 [Araneus ventricosus]